MKENAAREDQKKTAGRPRDPGTTRSILKAALELGMELGFDGLTVEGIAARAGVGKSTIYRRWPDAWSIIADAVFADVARIAPVLERATARESFRASMRLVARSFRGHHGEILRPLIGRAQVDKSLRQALAEHWLSARREISRKIVRRGIASGELRAGLDPDIVLDALYGPLYHRLLLPYEGDAVHLSDAYIDALVDTVFGGLERK
ncbi:MAG TPA: TetR/AcrR family transcriptional regulator [Tepidisphaeraceae bacterium]|jgi:AcrR family transcriptional regulator|nr:TetR/AcrR family transcriptional regulator [Tepidisphaeraceae bacterium]